MEILKLTKRIYSRNRTKMKFKSRKDILFLTIIYGFIIFLFTMILMDFLNDRISTMYDWTDLLMLIPIGLLIWMFHGTKYEITKQKLKYQSGPIKGEIVIAEITSIIRNKTLWAGMKPATARNGLIIKYRKYEEIYISPNTNDKFIKKILEINSDIEIKGN